MFLCTNDVMDVIVVIAFLLKKTEIISEKLNKIKLFRAVGF